MDQENYGAPKIENIIGIIETRLPPELIGLLKAAGSIAAYQGYRIYLVGGIVRDLFLEMPTFDIDLLVEGNAVVLARQLANISRSKLIVHQRFGTANLQWHKWSIDLTTVREETYAKPGALPKVSQGTLASDFLRRDFTINTMAVELNPGHFGNLIDRHGGRADLENDLIRILHDRSFIDDATRIWRGLRYEQRLDFRFEPETLRLLKRDLEYLDTISGDRIRHEIELVLKEQYPEKVLQRAAELNILSRVNAALKIPTWLADYYSEARRLYAPDMPPVVLYWALLAFPLSMKEAEGIIGSLRLPGTRSKVIRDTINLRNYLEQLSLPGISNASIYDILKNYSRLAAIANSIACENLQAKSSIRLFLDKLCYVKPSLKAGDLQKLGVPTGPEISTVLTMLHNARLNEEVLNRQEEEALVKKWLQQYI